ncbi:MAG: hypothetical protein AUG49_19805 [Catenulispora sp. 13_1_20CM_3_70_7]|nr:MAG: hypothetical protein AUG49_19805 [Catenulispora sp. 13_1_20CM_3_70_7]
MDGGAGSVRQVFRYPPFRWYFIGTGVSLTGTGMQFIGTAWLVLDLTGANRSIAIMLVCSTVPGIVLSPVIGVYVDRYDSRRLAAAMDLARAVAVLATAVLWYAGELRPWHLYLMTFLVAAGDAVYNPAVLCLIREITPAPLLLPANAATSIANQLGTLLGAALAGLVIAAFAPGAVMLVNAASFAVSAGCLWRIRARVGLGYLVHGPGLAGVYVLLLLVTSTVKVINALLPPFATRTLGLNATGFGYVDAAFGIGAILGNLLLARVTRWFGAGRAMVAGGLILAGGLGFFSLAQNLGTAVAGYLVLGTAFTVRVLYLTRAQQLTDLSVQGRVHSAFTTVISAATLVVYVAVGIVADRISLRWIYAAQAVLLFGAVALAMRVAARMRTAPVAAHRRGPPRHRGRGRWRTYRTGTHRMTPRATGTLLDRPM